MRKLLFFLAIISVSVFYSCEDSDDFSTDNSLKLSFSADTIRFEKALSSTLTYTRALIIRNPNDKSLTIASIKLMNADVSGFRIRIDGQNGTTFSAVDILKKDSLYAFIDIIAKEGCPPLIRDSIRFVTNGNEQFIQLEALGQDVHIWKGKHITADTVLTSEKHVLVYDSLIVDKDATLTVKEGVEFYFHHNARLHVNGTLDAQGTSGKPIVMRGDRFDNIEGDIPYDNVPGRWYGVVFDKQSYNNRLNNVVIKNTIDGVYFESSSTTAKKATLLNTTIQNSYGYGLRAVMCNIDAANSLFANTGLATVSLTGGAYNFIHCTMANYFRWSGRQLEILELYNTSDKINYPLTSCNIINSIIYGSAKNELFFGIEPGPAFEYVFRNCLIASPEKTDPRFVNTIWNNDPMFRDLNNGGRYNYNFRLNNGSPAVGIADKAYSVLYPYDMDGKLRDANPDIGCYEWYAQ